MSKHTLSSLLILGALITNAQANLTINGQHESTRPNKIETYFIKANSTGNVDIFLQSQLNTELGFDLPIDMTLTVWEKVGSFWNLIGANAGAARTIASSTDKGAHTIYGQTVLQYSGSFGDGMADPGLTLKLTSGSTYMIVNSEEKNGPTSLSTASVVTNPITYELGFGTQIKDPITNLLIQTNIDPLGQSIAISATTPGNYTNALKGLSDLSGSGENYSLNTPFVLTINGDVSLTTPPSNTPKKSQTITFVAIPSITTGKTGIISVLSNSNLAVSLTTASPTICSLSGNNITGKAVGTCTITATQAGNANYNSAQITKNILIGKGTQNISFGVKPAISVGKNGKITVSSSSKLAVALSAAPATVCSLKGNILTGKSTGTCTITANQTATINYLAALQKTQQITVTRGSQSINFGPTPVVLVGKTGNISATSTSKLPVTLTALPATVCTLKGTIITGKSVGTCTIKANRTGNKNYLAAPQKTLSFKITR